MGWGLLWGVISLICGSEEHALEKRGMEGWESNERACLLTYVYFVWLFLIRNPVCFFGFSGSIYVRLLEGLLYLCLSA